MTLAAITPAAGSARRRVARRADLPSSDGAIVVARRLCSFSSRSPTVGLVRLSPRMMRSTSLASSVSYLHQRLGDRFDAIPVGLQKLARLLVERVDQLLDFLVDALGGLLGVFARRRRSRSSWACCRLRRRRRSRGGRSCPIRATIWRAMPVAWRMSPQAPVLMSPMNISSAMRPPKLIFMNAMHHFLE